MIACYGITRVLCIQEIWNDTSTLNKHIIPKMLRKSLNWIRTQTHRWNRWITGSDISFSRWAKKKEQNTQYQAWPAIIDITSKVVEVKSGKNIVKERERKPYIVLVVLWRVVMFLLHAVSMYYVANIALIATRNAPIVIIVGKDDVNGMAFV